VLACLPEGEGAITGMFSSQRLAELRQQLPALEHRSL
jgi:deaminated glutathione amidase